MRTDHSTQEEAAYTLVAHAARLAPRDPATAAGLLGAATTLIQRSNRPVPPGQQQIMPDITDRCRNALGTARFATAYERGTSVDGFVLADLVSHIAHP